MGEKTLKNNNTKGQKIINNKKSKTAARKNTIASAPLSNDISIIPSMLKGDVIVPPSKSEAHRTIIAAALSFKECTISNVVMSDDILATLGCISAIGSSYIYNKEERKVIVFPAENPTGDNSVTVDCGESGSTLRFFMPILLVPNLCVKSGVPVHFKGHGRLLERPMKPYTDMFAKHNITYKNDGKKITLKGNLKSGVYEIQGNVSSQFITGLLFSLPLLDGDSEITVLNGAESKAYIDMTINTLKKFGIEIENRNYIKYIVKGNQKYIAQNITLEGDFSQAAFFLTAGAIGGDVTCHGLNPKSLQGDRAIVDIIKSVGGKITYDEATNSFRAYHTAVMEAIDIDASEIPDLVPILTVLFTFCKGTGKITNAGRLRMKESDRLSAISDELNRLGADIREGTDSLTINGRQTLNCETVSSRHDHRIAMSLAIAACRAEGDKVTITDAMTAIRKSYPDFFEDYFSLQK